MLGYAARRAVTPVARCARTYATEAAASGAGKLRLNFVVPHQSLLKNYEATQVNLSSSEGDMGILAEHVPTIAQLKAGIIEVFSATEKPQRFFASGGFAIINPDSTLNINAVEAVPVEDIDVDAARRALEEASRRAATGDVTAKIEVEVFESMVAAAQK
ncbi:delta subunit of the central stalk of mitochondrial F1F0 ATP synthase, atp16 [Gaertneriomyces sp. JEL0708]|nr:delta subunit of the central stalk of mitochondrial F1F0 ATP synthase, atp16 [Gaertneriomyces sp. JEL0708]